MTSPTPASPAYARSCPNCGRPLAPHAGDPQSAPWLCGPPAGCGRGWWVAELAQAPRQAWRTSDQDFGHGPIRGQVQGQVEEELVAARRRGTSALPEHLPLLSQLELDWLASRAQVGAIVAQQQSAAQAALAGGQLTAAQQQAVTAAREQIAALLGQGGVALSMVELIAAEIGRRAA